MSQLMKRPRSAMKVSGRRQRRTNTSARSPQRLRNTEHPERRGVDKIHVAVVEDSESMFIADDNGDHESLILPIDA